MNKKQFKFLVNKFIKENGLSEKWYHDTINHRSSRHHHIDVKYGLKDDDDFSTRLEKCVEIYVGMHPAHYGNSISGFFRYIPSSFDEVDWESFWKKYSRKFEAEYGKYKVMEWQV